MLSAWGAARVRQTLAVSEVTAHCNRLLPHAFQLFTPKQKLLGRQDLSYYLLAYLQFKRLPLLADQSGGGLLVGVPSHSVGVGAVGPLSTYRLTVCFSAAVGIVRYTQILFTPSGSCRYSFVGLGTS